MRHLLVLILMAFAITSTLLSINASHSQNLQPLSTDDPLWLTATSIVAHATETATVQLSTTPQTRETDRASSRDDQLALTATSIVARATQTTAAQLNTTVQTCGDFAGVNDPLALTATAIIAYATGTFSCSVTPTPTRTPEPTLTDFELNKLRREYKNTLVDALGFEHPIFEQIVTDFLNSEQELRSEHGLSYPFAPEIIRTELEDSEYIAVVIHAPHHSRLYHDRLYMFQITDNVPRLLAIPAQEPSTRTGISAPMLFTPSFGDKNNNGLLDLAVGGSWGGNCCLPSISLLEINADGDLVNITPGTDETYIVEYEDINNDGVYELIGNSNNSFSGYFIVTHWYGWNGTAYVDISGEYEEFYQPEIDALLADLENNIDCYPPEFTLEKALLFSFLNFNSAALVRQFNTLNSASHQCRRQIIPIGNMLIAPK
jgi:hypothetical protein